MRDLDWYIGLFVGGCGLLVLAVVGWLLTS